VAQTRTRQALLAPLRGLALLAETLLRMTVWSLTALSMLLLAVPGIGVFLVPAALRLVCGVALLARLEALRWSGIRVEIPQRCEPAPAGAGPWRRVGGQLGDQAVLRELAWLTCACFAGPVLGALALAPIPAAIAFGVVLPVLWWSLGDQALSPLISSAGGAATSFGIGLLVLAMAYWLGPALIDTHSLLARSLLSPSRGERLSAQLDRLRVTRADAVDIQAAELRRIERDLHDGAQARLVALGLTLAGAERLLRTDPEQAGQLLALARDTSAQALQELRDLVQGIHPPVLADRGLVDAVRALALDSPLVVHVSADLVGRPEPAVESAAYFAVAELLANVAKHAGAGRAQVIIGHDGQRLRVTVTDDGRGGADPDRGTGLLGVRRRLATFDGTLAVHSPAGGPTLATLELPCALS
jgi:signal transduction histidine kinase